LKPVSPELLQLFTAREFFVVDLYTFQLVNGQMLFYCSGDAGVVCNSIYYSAGGQVGPYFDREDNKAVYSQSTGVQVDQLSFDVVAGTSLIGSTPFAQAVRTGIMDGALMTLDRVFMPTYGDTSRGIVRIHVGEIAEVVIGRQVFTFQSNSSAELLDQQLPRNLWQPKCCNQLGDSQCGVNLTQYTANGCVAAAGSTNNLILTNSIPGVPASATNQAGAFNLGVIQFTSGALQGQSYGVRSVTYGSQNQIQLIGFAEAAPTAGDTFSLVYGCDKTGGFQIQVSGVVTAGQTNIDLTVAGGNTLPTGSNVMITGPGIPAGTYVKSYSATAPGTPPVPTEGALILSNPVTVTSKSASLTFWINVVGQIQNGCPKFGNQSKFRAAPFAPQPLTSA
jgi:uncharacterized phage protein (TIGR02218 family)